MKPIHLIQGESRDAMRALFQAGHRFTLAYLDAPFFSGRDYETADGDPAFSDKWSNLEAYPHELASVVDDARDLLLPDGSLVLHLDATAVHYAKVRCDAIFGRECFTGQIIWRYRRWPARCRNFQAMHDVLLRYVKDSGVESRWNQLFEPLSLKTQGVFKQAKQKAQVRQGGDGKSHRVRSVRTKEPSPGAPLCDVWDIPLMAPSGDERTGYPTQKPEALIARLVDALTNEGDAVLDPYCGSGTVPAVCAKRGRRCVSIDKSSTAIRIANERLAPILAQRSLFSEVGS